MHMAYEGANGRSTVTPHLEDPAGPATRRSAPRRRGRRCSRARAPPGRPATRGRTRRCTSCTRSPRRSRRRAGRRAACGPRPSSRAPPAVPAGVHVSRARRSHLPGPRGLRVALRAGGLRRPADGRSVTGPHILVMPFGEVLQPRKRSGRRDRGRLVDRPRRPRRGADGRPDDGRPPREPRRLHPGRDAHPRRPARPRERLPGPRADPLPGLPPPRGVLDLPHDQALIELGADRAGGRDRRHRPDSEPDPRDAHQRGGRAPGPDQHPAPRSRLPGLRWSRRASRRSGGWRCRTPRRSHPADPRRPPARRRGSQVPGGGRPVRPSG